MLPQHSTIGNGKSPTVTDNQTDQPEFEFKGVSHYFLTGDNDPVPAVSDINLAIRTGEFVTIIGPSGCGKSTLLNMAAGLLKPTHGQVSYRGRKIDKVNTSVGYVPQQDLLLPWRTVENNVGLALEIQAIDTRERKRRVAEILNLVGLERYAKRYPSELSGGMRKRTALARVLIYKPETLLMDEPFSALDAQLRVVMQKELLSLWSKVGQTVLFVTHDLEEAILLGDRIVVFGRSPGSVIHVEQLDLPRPRNLETLRTNPQFSDVWLRLWTMLEGERSSQSAQGAADASD